MSRASVTNAHAEPEAPPAYRDPVAGIAWQHLDHDCWWLPPSSLSLAGSPAIRLLSPVQQRRLSQAEFLHRLQLGLLFESIFIEQTGRLSRACADTTLRAQLLREIREEAGHSLMFLELMQRSGLPAPLPSGPSAGLALLARLAAAVPALYWTLVVAGEEIPNRLNTDLRRGTEEAVISAVVLRIASLHMQDEAQHVRFAREQCTLALAKLGIGSRRLLWPLVQRALTAIAWRLVLPPEGVYAAAGLAAPRQLVREAQRNPVNLERMGALVAPTRRFLAQAGWQPPAG
jgi:hypothetical protein